MRSARQLLALALVLLPPTATAGEVDSKPSLKVHFDVTDHCVPKLSVGLLGVRKDFEKYQGPLTVESAGSVLGPFPFTPSSTEYRVSIGSFARSPSEDVKLGVILRRAGQQILKVEEKVNRGRECPSTKPGSPADMGPPHQVVRDMIGPGSSATDGGLTQGRTSDTDKSWPLILAISCVALVIATSLSRRSSTPPFFLLPPEAAYIPGKAIVAIPVVFLSRPKKPLHFRILTNCPAAGDCTRHWGWAPALQRPSHPPVDLLPLESGADTRIHLPEPLKPGQVYDLCLVLGNQCFANRQLVVEFEVSASRGEFLSGRIRVTLPERESAGLAGTKPVATEAKNGSVTTMPDSPTVDPPPTAHRSVTPEFDAVGEVNAALTAPDVPSAIAEVIGEAYRAGWEAEYRSLVSAGEVGSPLLKLTARLHSGWWLLLRPRGDAKWWAFVVDPREYQQGSSGRAVVASAFGPFLRPGEALQYERAARLSDEGLGQFRLVTPGAFRGKTEQEELPRRFSADTRQPREKGPAAAPPATGRGQHKETNAPDCAVGVYPAEDRIHEPRNADRGGPWPAGDPSSQDDADAVVVIELAANVSTTQPTTSESTRVPPEAEMAASSDEARSSVADSPKAVENDARALVSKQRRQEFLDLLSKVPAELVEDAGTGRDYLGRITEILRGAQDAGLTVHAYQVRDAAALTLVELTHEAGSLAWKNRPDVTVPDSSQFSVVLAVDAANDEMAVAPPPGWYDEAGAPGLAYRLFEAWPGQRAFIRKIRRTALIRSDGVRWELIEKAFLDLGPDEDKEAGVR